MKCGCTRPPCSGLPRRGVPRVRLLRLPDGCGGLTPRRTRPRGPLRKTRGFFAQAEAENALARTPRIGHGKFQLLLVRGAVLYGMPGEALRRIREHNWLRLVDPAWEGVHATSECVNFPTRANWDDEAHPDTALAGELSFGLLGLRPTSPGFAACESRPVAVPGLSVSCVVPAARGPIG